MPVSIHRCYQRPMNGFCLCISWPLCHRLFWYHSRTLISRWLNITTGFLSDCSRFILKMFHSEWSHHITLPFEHQALVMLRSRTIRLFWTYLVRVVLFIIGPMPIPQAHQAHGAKALHCGNVSSVRENILQDWRNRIKSSKVRELAFLNANLP